MEELDDRQKPNFGNWLVSVEENGLTPHSIRPMTFASPSKNNFDNPQLGSSSLTPGLLATYV